MEQDVAAKADSGCCIPWAEKSVRMGLAPRSGLAHILSTCYRLQGRAQHLS